MSEMQAREVDKPNSVLASSSTALVRVQGAIPPAAQKGDRFDVLVSVPNRSETTDLKNGWLMASRLREYAYVNGRLAEGHVLALGQGDLLTEAVLENNADQRSRVRGYVLGGGVVTKSRGMGLMVRDDFTSVKTSARIGEAINRRFSIYTSGSKRGVANPKRDNFVELMVHPAYRGNIIRYLRVVQNIAVRETKTALAARFDELRQQMQSPSTAKLAAIQLEAIGDDAIPLLAVAARSENTEIAFCAAEALAYLDDAQGVAILGDIIRKQPAFRFRGLAALEAMEDIEAQEQLIDLLNGNSAETRYGAFRALRRAAPHDPLVRGEAMNDNFHLHVVSSVGTPLVHVSRLEQPEIVLFGNDHPLDGKLVAFAGEQIVVRGEPTGNLIVSRLSTNDHDEEVEVNRQLDDVIRGIVDLGGNYSDVVQALNELKRAGTLQSRLEFSAIPTTGRVYHRDSDSSSALPTDAAAESAVHVAPPMSESPMSGPPMSGPPMSGPPNSEPLNSESVGDSPMEIEAIPNVTGTEAEHHLAPVVTPAEASALEGQVPLSPQAGPQPVRGPVPIRGPVPMGAASPPARQVPAPMVKIGP